MKSIKVIIIALTFFLNACENPSEPNQNIDVIDIKELVLRDKFHNNGSSWANNRSLQDTLVKVYFIGEYEEIDSNYNSPNPMVDPSEELLNRFSNFRKIVKNVSQSEVVKTDYIELRDKETGGLGLIFYSGPIRWISSNEAEIEAGYYASGIAADCETYRVYKDKDRWYISYKIFRWVA